MQKNRQSTPGPAEPPEDQHEALTRRLHDLAADLARAGDGGPATGEGRSRRQEFDRLIRKCLQQKDDGVLYEALEMAQRERSVHDFLKEHLEEASGTLVLGRGEGRTVEINAFVIPLLARTAGGLQQSQQFRDEEAFEQLMASIRQGQLESPHATVILVSHAYHLEEIDRIGYSDLCQMVREAFDVMTSKKIPAAPAIGSSMRGWPENRFAADDVAAELRFLVGFALKDIDDPFYRIPQEEAAADRYFEEREIRFLRWTESAAPLVKRCLVADGREIEVDFLYQDLFHAGKDRGIAQYAMLQMLSELRQGLELHGLRPQDARAVVGLADAGGESMLRVTLHALADGARAVSADKPLFGDAEPEIDDACDALSAIGIAAIAVAARVEPDGQAAGVRER